MTAHTSSISEVISVKSESGSTKTFGFWVYLMTDLTLFSALFACFIVLRGNTFNGSSLKELFHLQPVLVETLCLLTSTFTCSLGLLSVFRRIKAWALIWFFITFCLGASFLYIEISEFLDFAARGATPQTSAALSSFFTLVGTHGFHITIGLLWMAVMMFRIASRPITHHAIARIFCMALFWHFLDFVWIFIFTIVYGMGYLL